MAGDPDGAGLFEVLLCASGGKVRAALTGRRFAADAAHEAGGRAGRAGHAGHEGHEGRGGAGAIASYLVRDQVAELAVDAAERAVRNGIPQCHEGTGCRPCGTCDACLDAMREAFTECVLGAIDPPGPLGARLKAAAMSVMGLPRIAVPWERGMSAAEAADLLDRAGEIGLVQGKETGMEEAGT